MIVGTAGITSGVLNCLTPAAAYQNFWLLFVVRLLKGTCAVSENYSLQHEDVALSKIL